MTDIDNIKKQILEIVENNKEILIEKLEDTRSIQVKLYGDYDLEDEVKHEECTKNNLKDLINDFIDYQLSMTENKEKQKDCLSEILNNLQSLTEPELEEELTK